MFSELFPSLRNIGWRDSTLGKRLFGGGDHSMESLCDMMMASDGEFSSLLIADKVFAAWESLDQEGLTAFFTMLNQRFDLDPARIESIAHDYAEDASAINLTRLTAAAEPRRQELFRRLNLVPGGTRRLVKMREQLLNLAREQPELKRMDVDFRHLFNSWFNRGFLVMRPVDWTTPAHILEKIIAYEAVHEIQNWNELRRRLEPQDRYCYAFFHPAMEDEPLVFVEVALTKKVPDKINQILDREREVLDPAEASCATFYSISSCHRGLGGVSFGNFLIKQVATSLHQRFPHLKTFATISPAPGFRSWLESGSKPNSLPGNETEQSSASDESPLADELLPQAAHYFLKVKARDNEPLDPVARFHLKNGARLDRLNPEADLSDKGIEQSYGLMVNYVYDLARVEENHENYMKNREVVCSSQIKKQLPA